MKEEREGEVDDAVDGFCSTICEAECAENTVDVPERLVCVWFMFLSNWMTDCLSNLSRTEMVHIMLSKE